MLLSTVIDIMKMLMSSIMILGDYNNAVLDRIDCHSRGRESWEVTLSVTKELMSCHLTLHWLELFLWPHLLQDSWEVSLP